MEQVSVPNSADSPDRQDQPIKRFARFFKAYGVGLSLVTAAVPLIMAHWDLVPLFTNTKNSLTIITSVGSYLLVGFIFSKRGEIGRLYFPGRGKNRTAYAGEVNKSRWFSLLPALLAVLFLVFFFFYLRVVGWAVHRAAYEYAIEMPAGTEQSIPIRAKVEPNAKVKIFAAQLSAFGQNKVLKIVSEEKPARDKDPSTIILRYAVQFPDEESVRAMLAGTPSASIPYAQLMAFLFLCAFLCASSAFILTGLKEYLQEEIGLADRDLLLSSTTTLLELEFGRKIPSDKAQGEQFTNRRLPEPCAHPPMDLW